jgi:hypothetical protein
LPVQNFANRRHEMQKAKSNPTPVMIIDEGTTQKN